MTTAAVLRGPRCVMRIAALAATLAAPSASHAQSASAAVAGVVSDHRTGAVVAGAAATLEETGRTVVTTADGRFVFDGLVPATYHVRVTAERFTAARLEVVAAGTAPTVSVQLEPEVHYAEVVSVSPNPRDAFESYQPTSVLAGQDLALKLESSLGELLKTEPGVAERSNGPGPSRPVIRGLDGDRVLILENGQRTDDLSSQSADHGVAISPLAAERIEVVRGPATLLYGANAIGGLVNVVTEVIPTTPIERTRGAFQGSAGSAAEEAGAAADISVGTGRAALRAGGSTARTSVVATPLGDVPNSQSRTAMGQIGASLTGANGFAGASYQFDDAKYGVPLVEDGQTRLTPRRHSLGARAQSKGLDGLVRAVRGAFNVRRYRHDELDGETVVTQFRNDTVDGELMASTRPIAGRVQGTYGVSGYHRSFDATGEEALSPPVDQRAFSAFTYQEASWSRLTLQLGGRVERVSFSPAGGLTARAFTNGSGSAGALFHPSDQTTLAVSVARAVRNPALEELYFLGPHVGNFAFEIGNPDLAAERATGVDVSYRWRFARASGEVTWFRNAIDHYVFRQPTGELDPEDGLPIVAYVGADALLQGVEAHADVDVTPAVALEVGVDYVRGSLPATDDPLPRMPPLRFVGGARFHWSALQIGGQVVAAARQDRVFASETPTNGYGVLKLFGVYSVQRGGTIHTFTLRLDNATNETYYNHLSFIKDLAPEMGRNVKIVYGVRM